MKTYCLYFLIFLALSCKNKESHVHGILVSDSVYEEKIIHTDASHRFQQRVKTSEGYQYTYRVLGTDSDGNEINGTIEMEGKFGTGTLIDANGNNRNIELQWIGYGVLKAFDEEENEYGLKVTE